MHNPQARKCPHLVLANRGSAEHYIYVTGSAETLHVRLQILTYF